MNRRYSHNHVSQLICHLISIERERYWTSYFHEPVVQGVDYSLFIMVVVLLTLEMAERRTKAILAAVLPPIFIASGLCFGVFISASSLFRVRPRALYIVSFRSRRRRGDENGWHQTLEVRAGHPGAAWKGGHASWVSSPSWLSSVASSSHHDPREKLRAPEKPRSIWVP